MSKLIKLNKIPVTIKDIIGCKFGHDCVVINIVGKKQYMKSSDYVWLAKCNCGNHFNILRKEIFGKYKRKVCPECSLTLMGKNNIIDMVGKRFNRLLVLDYTDKTNGGALRYLCKCDCGNIRKVLGRNLRNGFSQSCGCLNREISRLQCGSKSANWNPNITDQERQLWKEKRVSKELINWRKQVFERDYYICKCCGTTKSPFNAHHLNAWKDFPDQRYIVSNGLTLCIKCHKLFHKKYGNGGNTKQQYQEFFLLRWNG